MNRRHFTAFPLAMAAMGSCGPIVASAGEAPTILVVGDSLSAEYGLPRGSGWVSLLEQRLAASGLPHRVVNASISGDTTSGGRSRLDALLRAHRPAVVVLELGGNDALRGLPLEMTQDNLTTMTRLSHQAGARVILVGMEMPPNYGKRYGDRFRELFGTVAREEKATLVPFLLKGVADTPNPTALFQADRIHPNATAQRLMLENVWPVLRPLLTTR